MKVMGAGVLGRRTSRRTFLAGAAVTAGAAATLAVTGCDPLIKKLYQQQKLGAPHHMVWVWQFSYEGPVEQIGSNLAANHLGIVLKTHDATSWMSRYDTSPQAVTGAGRVRELNDYYEGLGVPFHTWCVVRGIDPVREAQMAAEVLDAGPRSLTLDLEAGEGFWAGAPDAAQRFGEELRRLRPYDRVDISIDPRPWRFALVPLAEFVGFCDGLWPQTYWDSFNSKENIDAFRFSGLPPPPEGITPEFLLDVCNALLPKYERPIIPAGQGASPDNTTWPRFVGHARALGMPMTSAWRYGVTPYDRLVWLGQQPAG